MIGRILTVARRELRSYFDHATAYILLVIFLGINFFFFFRDVYLIGEASLRSMIGLLPWLFLFFVPAVGMRALAEERRSGTLELVLAQPISELEFLIGKFLGVLGFMAIALVGTIGAPLGLSLGADLQWGVIVAQYIGSTFLVATLVAISLWASSLTRNQVTAFILGVTITFVLYALALETVLLGLPGTLARIAGSLGILTHFSNIARGVIDLRDVLYFGSVTAAFLALSYFALMREKLSRTRPSYRRLRIGTIALVGVAVLVSLLGSRVRGRLDLTPGKAYTLSRPTRAILSRLDDLVTVKFFRSGNLPPQILPVRRDVEDLLRDLDAAGGSNLEVLYLSPEEDDEVRREAANLGINPVQFNVYGQDEFQVRQGYLGIAIQYAGQSEAIPFVRQTADLEYRVASAVRTLTRERRPSVAFLSGHGEKDLSSNLTGVASQLRESYAVESVILDSAITTQIGDSVDVLVVAGPVMPVSVLEGEEILRYLERGGNMLLLLSGVQIDQRSNFAFPAAQPVLDSLLSRYGLEVVPGLAYDVRSRFSVPLRGRGGFTIMTPYPLWPLLQTASDHITVSELGPVLAPYSSAIDATAADSGSVIPLLSTTESGGRLSGQISLDANQDWVSLALDLSPQLVAVAVAPRDGRTTGRVVLVGNVEMITDDMLRINANGAFFFLNAVDWLAQDEALISIRSKDRTPPQLLFESAFARDATKYGNMVGVPLLLVFLGIVRLARRRATQRRVYGGSGEAS